MRVLLNGRAPASQAGHEGSIPFTRSKRAKGFENSLAFTMEGSQSPREPGCLIRHPPGDGDSLHPLYIFLRKI